MNDRGGYLISWRRKWDNPVFANKAEAAVWAWMCDIAQSANYSLPTKFGPVELRRGELLMAERELAEDFGLSRKVLRNLLQRMIDTGMIELHRDRCPHRAGTVVHLVNYDGYQGAVVAFTTGTENEPQTVPQRDRKGTVNGSGNSQQDQPLAADFCDARDRKRTAKGPQTNRKGTKNNSATQESTIEAGASMSDGTAAVGAEPTIMDWLEEHPPEPPEPPRVVVPLPVIDPRRRIFGECLGWLMTATGKPEPACRKLLGRWVRDHRDAAVLAAFEQASRSPPVGDVVAFITGILNREGRTHGRQHRETQSERLRRGFARAYCGGMDPGTDGSDDGFSFAAASPG
jgi:hypothetical protein